MTREQLDAAHSAAITRHWRGLADSGGTLPQALLDELAAIDELRKRQMAEDWMRANLNEARRLLDGLISALDAAVPAEPAPQRRPAARAKP